MLPLRLISNTSDNSQVDGLSPEKAFLYNENKGTGFGRAKVKNSYECGTLNAECNVFCRVREG
jgi:hypothetical protein